MSFAVVSLWIAAQSFHSPLINILAPFTKNFTQSYHRKIISSLHMKLHKTPCRIHLQAYALLEWKLLVVVHSHHNISSTNCFNIQLRLESKRFSIFNICNITVLTCKRTYWNNHSTFQHLCKLSSVKTACFLVARIVLPVSGLKLGS